ncbi:MAG: histone deacetylase [Deltaproteobacteria bacterium]|nr:histone deacetylase [Deltaproteobacteria bacterium]
MVQDERFFEHQTGMLHPESPDRLKAVYRMVDQFPAPLIHMAPEAASLAQLELFHSSAYIQMVLKTADREFTYLAPDTPAGRNSYMAAALAAGGCIKGLDHLFSGACSSCFALIRPPGHHAMPDRATGFCIFNNLGIAAAYALAYGAVGRILIVDWDIHHGQGLQEFFYRDRRVLYLSSHYIQSYPQTGGWEETGEGGGKGYTINIPLKKGMVDADMIDLYDAVLPPVIERFQPELILVAAGFDGHRDDPMSRTSLTDKAFGCITQRLIESAARQDGIPILLSLEGGYDPRALSASVRAVLMALCGQGAELTCTPEHTRTGEELMEKLKKVHAGLPPGFFDR